MGFLIGTPVPAVRDGSSHTLRAVLEGEALAVWADGELVWEGSLPPQLLDFDGPVGLRTDNAAVELEYTVGGRWTLIRQRPEGRDAPAWEMDRR
jgi:hypothetical protein